MIESGDPITPEQQEQMRQLWLAAHRLGDNVAFAVDGENWKNVDALETYLERIVRLADEIGIAYHKPPQAVRVVGTEPRCESSGPLGSSPELGGAPTE